MRKNIQLMIYCIFVFTIGCILKSEGMNLFSIKGIIILISLIGISINSYIEGMYESN